MFSTKINGENDELRTLCLDAKRIILSAEYQKCYDMVCKSMSRYPDSPRPHNLLGILYEHEGYHTEAMKHFRTALALDPTFFPASRNMDIYGNLRPAENRSFYGIGRVRRSDGVYQAVYDM